MYHDAKKLHWAAKRAEHQLLVDRDNEVAALQLAARHLFGRWRLPDWLTNIRYSLYFSDAIAAARKYRQGDYRIIHRLLIRAQNAIAANRPQIAVDSVDFNLVREYYY